MTARIVGDIRRQEVGEVLENTYGRIFTDADATNRRYRRPAGQLWVRLSEAKKR